MYYVYLIKNENDEKYIGFTSDLKQRFEAHNSGKVSSTKGHQWTLIYYEAFQAESDARRREKALKQSGQSRRWLYSRVQNSLCA